MLCLIKAYEVMVILNIRKLLTKAMLVHPKLMSYRNFSFVEGLVGWGEIFMEAFRVFKNEEWLNKAGWIVSLLLCTARVKKDGLNFWIVEDNKQPTADFMVGNSGLMHFLLRYLGPSTL